ncbi:acid phosphatase [Rhizobium sp. NRK18]|uniref:acid phosphatase n=1 Tax=Rhizobium sp. NRK18 TaxID=2964667 RepID=UPI0021C3FCC5|nr:phosphatase PAP2 family protein [Rhizobium sp. NRK18]MCQ2005281.1 phosphatase PAP2 family protein [Rhizobium sp. NRK18]
MPLFCLPLRSRRLFASTAIVLLAGSAVAAPVPAGTFTVPVPETAYPLPVVDNYKAQAGLKADGSKINKYDRADNPIIQILSGFDDIWSLGDAAWANGGANGDGAEDYSKVKIVAPDIWAANMRYVLDVTGPSRTSDDALAAYLDDRRAQGNSVIDGMGPLADIYRREAGATTTIAHTLADFDPNAPLAEKEEDQGSEAGTGNPSLQDFIAFMTVMRGPEGSTSPAKYFYASPRPWRMTDSGDVVQTGTEPLGDKTVEVYDSHVNVIPALLSARETRGRRKDGGFPSGHTNAAYVSAIAYAYALPVRFAELLTRASELGEHRVVTGMHSPLDVIGGRIMATATAAAYLNDPANAELKARALENMTATVEANVPTGESLYAAAHTAKDDRFSSYFSDADAYRQRMTYGLPQDKAKAGQAMVVPKGAEALIETRFPYLDAGQRRIVLYTTGIDSGYPLLDKSNGWGRLDLVAAAGGFGAFPGDVTVDMQAGNGGFNADDQWLHDIAGKGMLTKAGNGTLTLAGHNSYAGGTVLKDGTLVAAHADALGTGDLQVDGGTLAVGMHGVVLPGDVAINGGTLQVDISGAAPDASVVAIKAGRINGTFAQVVSSKGQTLDASYDNGTLTVRLPAPKPQAG